MSGKIAGKLSCGIAAQLPGNRRVTANAMPPDGRADSSQAYLLCAGAGRAMAAPETCETTRNMTAQRSRNGQWNIPQDDSSESRLSTMTLKNYEYTSHNATNTRS